VVLLSGLIVARCNNSLVQLSIDQRGEVVAASVIVQRLNNQIDASASAIMSATNARKATPPVFDNLHMLDASRQV
jgi:hypothetical protein